MTDGALRAEGEYYLYANILLDSEVPFSVSLVSLRHLPFKLVYLPLQMRSLFLLDALQPVVKGIIRARRSAAVWMKNIPGLHQYANRHFEYAASLVYRVTFTPRRRVQRGAVCMRPEISDAPMESRTSFTHAQVACVYRKLRHTSISPVGGEF